MKTLAQSVQTNTKLKHKNLFKLLTQNKGKHTNMKSEYLQNNKHCSLRNNLEECSSHMLRGGSLKSRTL